MMLYHGTALVNLQRIQREGIAPRAISKAKDNWKHTVTSNKDAVYLTTSYPLHFAYNVAIELSDKRGLIFEIPRHALLPWLLCPDEDFLEQTTRKVGPEERPNHAPTDWPMKKRTRFYRKLAKYNPKLVDASLNYMGTAAYYGVIPWKAVTRYAIVDWEKMPRHWYWAGTDTMVSVINHQILATRHKALIKWLFGDPVTVEESDSWLEGLDQVKDLDDHMRKMKQERYAQVSAAVKSRDGVSVVSNML